ncbi:MAG: hypothetical protein ABI175_30430 [Polyangiales bacterium]
MSISSVVAELALSLDPVITDDGARKRLAAVGEMPRFVTEERLDLWEEAVLAHGRIPKETAQELAVAELIELARFNMYGEIDEDETRLYLERAIASARAAGATVTVDRDAADITEW